MKYWDNVRKLTLHLLELFPEDQMTFRPTKDVRNVAEQFTHIVDVELYIRRGLVNQDWIYRSSPDFPILEKKSLYDRLYNEHQRTNDFLKMMPEGRFMKTYETKFGSISGEAIIYVAIDEEIHHRGNLYVYLRLLGIEPPQMIHHYNEIFKEDTNG